MDGVQEIFTFIVYIHVFYVSFKDWEKRYVHPLYHSQLDPDVKIEQVRSSNFVGMETLYEYIQEDINA